MASSILTQHNDCDLTPLMCGTWQNWSLVWKVDLMTTILPPGPTAPQESIGIDSEPNAVITMALAASKAGMC